jgi:pimeloyl-[acyl-carrier protein] methyl ester esterase
MTKLVLLPGLDGTGELFAEFKRALPSSLTLAVVSYPANQRLDYTQLLPIVRQSIPHSESFVIVAESFSTPLAIAYAATRPANLKALVICAGFATSPVRGVLWLVARLVIPLSFRVPISEFAAKHFLVGKNASPQLVADVRSAIARVQPSVLSARLRAVLSCDARAQLGEVDVPILYLQATDDRLVSKSCVEEICRSQPRTKAVKLRGPHLILQRQPKAAAEAIEDFIAHLG